MLEDFGAGQSAILSDMTDDNYSSVGGFGGADDEITTVGDLRNSAGGGGNFVHG